MILVPAAVAINTRNAVVWAEYSKYDPENAVMIGLTPKRFLKLTPMGETNTINVKSLMLLIFIKPSLRLPGNCRRTSHQSLNLQWYLTTNHNLEKSQLLCILIIQIRFTSVYPLSV